MRALLVIVLFGLSCCADPYREARDAEHQEEMVEAAHGTNTEICHAKERVADAWLRSGNQSEYDRAKLSRDIACGLARYEPDAQPPSARGR